MIEVNTILHTRDGRVIGNALITKSSGHPLQAMYEVTTDYGNKARMSEKELGKLFYLDNLVQAR